MSLASDPFEISKGLPGANLGEKALEAGRRATVYSGPVGGAVAGGVAQRRASNGRKKGLAGAAAGAALGTAAGAVGVREGMKWAVRAFKKDPYVPQSHGESLGRGLVYLTAGQRVGGLAGGAVGATVAGGVGSVMGRRADKKIKKSEAPEEIVSLSSDPFEVAKSFKNPSERYKRKVSVEAGRQRVQNSVINDMNSSPAAQTFGVKHPYRSVISGDTKPPVEGLDDVAAKGRRVMARQKLVRRAGATAVVAVPVATVVAASKPSKVKKNDDPLHVFKAAFGQEGDKRNTKYAAAGLAGAYGGAMAGEFAAARSGGIPLHATKKKAARTALDVSRKTAQTGAGFRASHKAGRTAGKAVPGAARIMTGSKIGAAAGATTAAAAYAVHRRHKSIGGIAKAEKKTGLDQFRSSEPTLGRRALVALSPTIHGALAGKKDHKLRAIGNQTGMAAAGSVSGSLLGAGLTRSMAGAQVGRLAGSLTGGQLGLNRAQNMGHLKSQRKKKS